jgi:hypothetical protein
MKRFRAAKNRKPIYKGALTVDALEELLADHQKSHLPIYRQPPVEDPTRSEDREHQSNIKTLQNKRDIDPYSAEILRTRKWLEPYLDILLYGRIARWHITFRLYETDSSDTNSVTLWARFDSRSGKYKHDCWEKTSDFMEIILKETGAFEVIQHPSSQMLSQRCSQMEQMAADIARHQLCSNNKPSLNAYAFGN